MQSELTERAKTAWNSIADEFNQWDALGLDEKETYVALTAALVDVPAVESEPVGYLFELFYPGSDRWSGQMFSDHDPAANLPAEHVRNVRPLYTHPPLREGEDSAEVVIPADLVKRCEEVLVWEQTGILQDGGDLHGLASRIRKEFNDALSQDEALYHAEEKTKREAMRIVTALAVTRSGSATDQKGVSE